MVGSGRTFDFFIDPWDLRESTFRLFSLNPVPNSKFYVADFINSSKYGIFLN